MLSELVARAVQSNLGSSLQPLLSQVAQASQTNATVGTVGNVYNGMSSTSLDDNGSSSSDNGTADNLLLTGVANAAVGARVVRPGDPACSIGGRMI